MNKLKELFKTKSEDILNIYFTAGYPDLNDTSEILLALDKAEVDIVEIGIPYSDPLADGLTIQKSSEKALKNGMHLELLFEEIHKVKDQINTPIVMMGYYNQFLQYGIEKLIKKLEATGIDGMIIPDLPLEYFEEHYKPIFDKHDISISFLITPETPESRIRKADELSTGFVYMVAQASITGETRDISDEQKNYFQRIENMQLNTPRLIGFGIHDNKSYEQVKSYAQGAIIGSAFIRQLQNQGVRSIDRFVQNIRQPA